MNAILVYGESGQGKSYSISTLNPQSTLIINVANKPLPFKGGKQYKTVHCESATEVMKAIDDADKNTEIKVIVIDDAQYVMGFEFLDRAKEKGFDKFTEIGQNFYSILKRIRSLRSDLYVVILAHSEDIIVDGVKKTKIKTIGRMLDEKLTIEGLFTVVLKAITVMEDGVPKYYFVTQSDGTNTVKSPQGMFPSLLIPNDLKYVLQCYYKYYNEE